MLVDTRMTKQASGRKSGGPEGQCICQLTSYRLRRGAFRSNAGERQLREMLGAQLGSDLTGMPRIGQEATLTAASEIGPDVSRFLTARYFRSERNLAPPTRISGDRKIAGKAPKRTNPVA